MILVDTSVWVEYDQATQSAAHLELASLISGAGDIFVTEPILMEVLAGARDERAGAILRRLLTSFGWLPFDAVADFEGAAKVYRACRRAGITPRGLIDCMIVAVALRTGSELLTTDQDFERLSGILPLRLHAPAHR